MSLYRKSLSLIAIPILIFALYGGAQAKRKMSAVDLLEVPQVNSPQLSPDGTQILFVQSNADWKGNRRVSHIWRIQSDGTGLVQMTNGPRGESSPRWSPDGKSIAFIARRSGAGEENQESSQIFTMSNSGGEALQLTRHETSVSSYEWAPDGSRIYFLASDPKSAEEKEKEKMKDDVFAFDEDYKQTHLWTVDVADRAEKRITGGNYSVTSFKLSNDGTKIAFIRAPSPLFGDADQGEVYVMNADGRAEVQITKNRVTEGDIELSPDNSRIIFTSGSNEKFETYYNGKLFMAPASGGEARLLLTDFPRAIDSAAWSKDGKTIYLVCNLGVETQIFEVDVATKSVKQRTQGGHALGSWSYFKDRATHAFTLSTPKSPGEVHLLREGQSNPTQVTRIFEYIDRDFRIPREEKISWKGADGVTVEGILTYPLDYQEGRRYPLVVNTHGGPASSDKLSFSSWSHYRPILAAAGYAILRPNYRGSTGYGDDFLRDMVGHYFRQAHLDVMAGVDYLIERGIADPDKMVKMGWSAGGHMTNKIITHTDRFKAASSGAGAANWISMYAQSDVRTYRTPWFGGTPWQKDAPISAYWDHSPLKDVWKVKTPTLFLVGENDVRVPPQQSVEMYRALKSNGVPTHLYIAPREPHGWGELRHELFKINVELDWYEKHVHGRAYTWEKPPKDADAKGNKATEQP